MQDDLAPLHFDRDLPGIRLRIADEGSLDVLLQVCGPQARLDQDLVTGSCDP